MSFTYDEIKSQAYQACKELVEIAKLQKGDIFVVGCSSSEVMGQHIGKASDINAAGAVYEGIMSVLEPMGIYIAVGAVALIVGLLLGAAIGIAYRRNVAEKEIGSAEEQLNLLETDFENSLTVDNFENTNDVCADRIIEAFIN